MGREMRRRKGERKDGESLYPQNCITGKNKSDLKMATKPERENFRYLADVKAYINIH